MSRSVPALKGSGQFHVTYAFGKFDEYAHSLTKGSHLMVQGPVRSREYERDGMKQRVFELRAEAIAKPDRAERRQDTEVEPEDTPA